MNKTIPYGCQSISEDDVRAVSDALKDELITTGPKVKLFEEFFAKYVGSKYAVAVSSGTAALHVACLAAGLSKGDELITSPMTFAASANCALYCGAKPIFVDITNDGLIDPARIDGKISKETRVIIPVHYAGNPCDMKKIKEIAYKHGLTVIEDACHALGATYLDSKIGDCKFSDMAVFSFHPVKHITTGEGGMITTNSQETYLKLLSLRDHGMVRTPDRFIRKPDGPWHHEMQILGFNYRMTDIQSALGLSQLKRLKTFIHRRKEIADRYNRVFEGDDHIDRINQDQEKNSSYHLYVVKVKDKDTRLQLFNYLRNNGIGCQVHYIPVYWHPYYESLGYHRGLCPVAEDFYGKVISLPIYSELTHDEHSKVIKVIKKFFTE